MGTNPYVGIAYTTHNNSVLDTSVIDHVTLEINNVPDTNLLNFVGKNQDNKSTLLTWTSTGEINIDHFEIQRSLGNTDFQIIGTVVANGNPGQSQNYSFTDYLPSDGNNYYRLKQVDKSRNASYSAMVLVRFNLKAIIIYPNPAHDNIYIRNNDNFSNGKKIIVQLLDFSGKLIYKQEFQTYGVDINTFKIPQTIAEGMYVLLIANSNGDKQTEKVYISR